MNTDLEKFIRENRKTFDEASPSDKTWENIEQSIAKRKQANRFSIKNIYKWGIAATIFFVLLTSIYFLFVRKYSPEKQVAKNEVPANNGIEIVKSIAPEYSSEFKEVFQSVLDRQKELQSTVAADPELYKQFQKDLNALDSSYLLLKKQIVQTPNKDIIIKAMIENLQLQAELLNRQLMIFNQFKNKKTVKNETSI